MNHLDAPKDNQESYETRELTWELQQKHADTQRIKFLIEQGADIKHALHLAKIQEKDLMKRPELRPLQLQKHFSGAEKVHHIR